MPEPSEVLPEPADHDRLKLLGLDVDAAGEALRVEDFEECRKGVRMAVVRRRRQEQTMLQQRRDLAHGPGELTFDSPNRARGGPCVVRLIENEQRAGAEGRKEVTKPAHVGLVGEHTMRDRLLGRLPP